MAVKRGVQLSHTAMNFRELESLQCKLDTMTDSQIADAQRVQEVRDRVVVALMFLLFTKVWPLRFDARAG